MGAEPETPERFDRGEPLFGRRGIEVLSIEVLFVAEAA
jgi:hypothetical protein